MSRKMVIINDCIHCGNHYVQGGTDYCFRMDDKEINDAQIIPDWCPLPSMPERKYEWYDDDRDDYALGWNTCLDTINRIMQR